MYSPGQELADATMGDEDLTEEQQSDLRAIRLKKKQIVLAHRMKKGAMGRQAILPGTADGDRSRTTDNMKVRERERDRVR